MSIKKLILISTLLFSSIATAYAATPHLPDMVRGGNRWLITAYDDSSTVHQQWATQGICFYYAGVRGTHQLYYWVSDTFPDWNGRAEQEGDQVFMFGDYAQDVGHDGMEIQVTTMSRKDEAFGHWHEWRENGRYGRTIGFANTKLTRVGSCRATTIDEAVDIGLKLNLPSNENGELIVTPAGFSERQIEELKE